MKTLLHTKPSALDQIEFAKFPVIMAPFHGVPVPVKLCELDTLQIMECGDISLIQTIADKIKQGRDIRKINEAVKYAETMHKIVKAALICPTYDKIQNMVGSNLNNKEIKEKISALEKQIYPLSPTSNKRIELEDDMRRLRIWIDLILPADFTNFIACYALGIDKSDIKKINEKTLLELAVLAENGHKAPHEYLNKCKFTEFNKIDIDRRAYYELYKYKEANQSKNKKKVS